MRKAIHLNELDPTTQHRVIGSLHEQGLIEGLRQQGKNSREIVDTLAREHANKRHRKEPKAKPIKHHPWYVTAFKLWTFMLAYMFFCVGWLFEYGGYYLKRLGEEMRNAARSI
jgi:hypothetical protein